MSDISKHLHLDDINIPKIGTLFEKTVDLHFGTDHVTAMVVAVKRLEVPGEEDEYIVFLGNRERVLLSDGWGDWTKVKA